MSELRPTAPARRPDTVRPRTSDEHQHDDEVHVEPPTTDELEAIERHLASLPVHAGASAAWHEGLQALVVHQAGAGPAGNVVAMPRWSAAGWQHALNQATHLVRQSGSWPSLVVADRLDRPIGLGDALARVGWQAVQRETAMWVGRASVIAHLDPRMRIEAVQARAVEAHEAVEREVFGLPDDTAPERRAALVTALGTGRLRAFVVRVEDEPVAVARLSQGEGVAGLYGIGVREAWRGRGYGTLITTVATRAGMAIGNRLVWLSVEDDNDAARHVYRKLHFQDAFGWRRWLASAEQAE